MICLRVLTTALLLVSGGTYSVAQDPSPDIGSVWIEVGKLPFNLVNHATVVFKGREKKGIVEKMYVLGGSDPYGGGTSDQVLSSRDGANWEIAFAPWSPRQDHSAVVFDGKIWIFGGANHDDSVFFNDVWSSSDGEDWTQVTESAPWVSRAFHSSVVYDGKMWIIGGNRGNDIWFSSDGVIWTPVIGDLPWQYLASHSSVVYDDKMWVLGGVIKLPNTLAVESNLVWCSSDGIEWRHVFSRYSFSDRRDPAAVVFQDKIFLMGGLHGVFPDGMMNDVWQTPPVIDWTEIETADDHWSPRMGHTVVAFRGAIWIISGRSLRRGEAREVWRTAGVLSELRQNDASPVWALYP